MDICEDVVKYVCINTQNLFFFLFLFLLVALFINVAQQLDPLQHCLLLI